jgi:hypothetical protein
VLLNNGPITAVFSHPNHEIAIYCLLQSIQPHFVFLTDGGGEKRLEQTRQGLESIGLLHRAQFLNYTEKSFYDALLDSDLNFFKNVATLVADILKASNSSQILCDAVEFYNPVHDMSFPIVMAAIADSPGVKVFEVPLVYQQSGPDEVYAVQQMPPSRRRNQVEFRLSDHQRNLKMDAWHKIYTMLVEQMGSLVSELPNTEIIAPASPSLPEPGPEQIVRYEWRAQRLLDCGEIERKITYTDHYLPIATPLINRLH